MEAENTQPADKGTETHLVGKSKKSTGSRYRFIALALGISAYFGWYYKFIIMNRHSNISAYLPIPLQTQIINVNFIYNSEETAHRHNAIQYACRYCRTLQRFPSCGSRNHGRCIWKKVFLIKIKTLI